MPSPYSSTSPPEVSWQRCATCTPQRAHHHARVIICFCASRCSREQAAPALSVLSIKNSGSNIQPFHHDENPCHSASKYTSCQTAQLQVSHLLLFPSGILTCVIQPCWRSGASPTRNKDSGNAQPSCMFPHPLSLLGVADSVPAVALSLS